MTIVVISTVIVLILPASIIPATNDQTSVEHWSGPRLPKLRQTLEGVELIGQRLVGHKPLALLLTANLLSEGVGSFSKRRGRDKQ